MTSKQKMDDDKDQPVISQEDHDAIKKLASFKPGVYRHTSMATIGTGSTSKRKVQIIDYYIKDLTPGEDMLIEAQVVDYMGKPIQMFDRLKPSQVYQCRLLCEDINKLPEMLKKLHMLKSHIAVAEQHYQRSEFHSAEYEFDNALKIEGKNVEANLGKGKTLFKLERYEEAREIFDELADNTELYTEEHKHLFNEYGINLRQLEMYDKAIESYKRAIVVNPYDPNLFYNLAVAYVKKRDRDSAIKVLQRAVMIMQKLEKRDFPEARRLLEKLNAPKGA